MAPKQTIQYSSKYWSYTSKYWSRPTFMFAYIFFHLNWNMFGAIFFIWIFSPFLNSILAEASLSLAVFYLPVFLLWSSKIRNYHFLIMFDIFFLKLQTMGIILSHNSRVEHHCFIYFNCNTKLVLHCTYAAQFYNDVYNLNRILKWTGFNYHTLTSI